VTLSFKSPTKFLYAPLLSPYLLHAPPISLYIILMFVNCVILLLKWIFIVQHLILPLLVLTDISWLGFYSNSIITLTIYKSCDPKFNYDLGTALGSSLSFYSVLPSP